jgi:hypothetical protein
MTKAHYHHENDDINIVDFDNMTQIINNFGKTGKIKSSKFQSEI